MAQSSREEIFMTGFLLRLLVACWSAAAVAVPVATVELVTPPVQRELAGQRVPLAAGETLVPGTRLTTGVGSRVLLRLGEGSEIKLGESTTFALAAAVPAAAGDAPFRAALEILTGAFRFTTTALGQGFRRDIRASVGTTTIGIRGTDVWGRASPTRDFVVLIEGDIELTRAGDTVRLREPQTAFSAEAGATPAPLRRVEGAELAAYAAETEPATGEGALVPDGRWQLVLSSYRTTEAPETLVARIREAGYPAETGEVRVAGSPRPRVLIVQVASREAAEALAARITRDIPGVLPWVAAP
jgi:hypothetical protein